MSRETRETKKSKEIVNGKKGLIEPNSINLAPQLLKRISRVATTIGGLALTQSPVIAAQLDTFSERTLPHLYESALEEKYDTQASREAFGLPYEIVTIARNVNIGGEIKSASGTGTLYELPSGKTVISTVAHNLISGSGILSTKGGIIDLSSAVRDSLSESSQSKNFIQGQDNFIRISGSQFKKGYFQLPKNYIGYIPTKSTPSGEYSMDSMLIGSPEALLELSNYLLKSVKLPKDGLDLRLSLNKAILAHNPIKMEMIRITEVIKNAFGVRDEGLYLPAPYVVHVYPISSALTAVDLPAFTVQKRLGNGVLPNTRGLGPQSNYHTAETLIPMVVVLPGQPYFNKSGVADAEATREGASGTNIHFEVDGTQLIGALRAGGGSTDIKKLPGHNLVIDEIAEQEKKYFKRLGLPADKMTARKISIGYFSFYTQEDIKQMHTAIDKLTGSHSSTYLSNEESRKEAIENIIHGKNNGRKFFSREDKPKHAPEITPVQKPK